jgi:hypothetical protein
MGKTKILLGRRPKVKYEESEPEQADEPEVHFLEPQICLFDMNANAKTNLERNGFSVFDGSLGSVVIVNNRVGREGYCCLPNYVFPPNIHEYAIFVLNLCSTKRIDYVQTEHRRTNIKHREAPYLYCQFPRTLFDPKALACQSLNEEIQKIVNKPCVTIAFGAPYEKIEYEVGETDGRFVKVINSFKCTNYDFLTTGYPGGNLKQGVQFEYCHIAQPLKKLFERHIEKAMYRMVFDWPTTWPRGEKIPVELFEPILTNREGEIVSYIQRKEKFIDIVLPDIEDKDGFIVDLISNVLPDLFPEVFPFSEKGSWLNDRDYYLPNYHELVMEERSIEDQYQRAIKENQDRIDRNRENYEFLHGLLVNTGNALVRDVIRYLKWIGFENIRDMDAENPKLKEEDIQLETEKGLLVVEAKGIAGTSKDEECSQISKIRYRRCEERKSFDVFALYLVNHQRNIPAKQRQMPPFTEMQISDAIREKRGLLTTWQLFNLFFAIEDGIIEKQQGRETLFRTGFIDLLPEGVLAVGTIKAIYKEGMVGIVDLEDTEIKMYDQVFYLDNWKYVKLSIVSIQLDGTNVDKAANAEAGILFDGKVRKGIKLLINRAK